MARPKGSVKRAEGMTQISISLSEELVNKIDKLAAQDQRNRSNFISYYLSKLAEDQNLDTLFSQDKKALK